jgi:hypothetical protein
VPIVAKPKPRGRFGVADERSFKDALAEEVQVVDRKAKSIQAVSIDQPRQEVVWEVEVEEEVLAKLGGAYVGYLSEDKKANTIQNHFRMDGYINLKICSLGYRKILLWSDTKGELKEVIESVGWWCSLFERVVPWSPLLVSSNRATWIRVFGVPLHAWGVDLFRAVAFKFGRFIEVDDRTKKMDLCDFARVRVLTGERKIIDASMAVKVLGVRFDLRVVE